MKILLAPFVYDVGYDVVFDLAATRLRELQHDVVVSAEELTSHELERFDLLISNKAANQVVRDSVPTIAGIATPRATELRLLQEHDIPTMDWRLVPRRLDLINAFIHWKTFRILLKRSFTSGGAGVTAFSPWHFANIKYNKNHDLVCRIVNPHDGDIWKAELFDGELLISWVSRSKPVSLLPHLKLQTGIDGAYGDRERIAFPASLIKRLADMSKSLTDRGMGQVSFDFMRDKDGEFNAIEFNSCFPAMWWTSQFDDFRSAFVESVVRVVEKRSL